MTTELVQAGGALAIRPDQTAWTPEQQAWLQQSGIDNQVTAAELSGFLHLCQRTQLDPFSRQIYLIGRYDKRAGRMVFTPQTGIDGYRVVAHRVVASSGDNFGYEDALWCDESGRWRDVWLSDQPPAAVKVAVLRNGQRFSAVALFREYVQTSKENRPIGLWGKMPASQLAKCAEALALRKAFPFDLAGVYTAEEMAQSDNPTPERHLRSVQGAEPDQWTTPAPQSETESAPTVEPHPPAQEIADQAADAKNKARIKKLWTLAKTGRLMEAPVRPKGQQDIEELGAYLMRRGSEVPEAAPTDDDITDAEIAPDAPEDEHAAAVAALHAAASKARMDNVEEEFIASYGLPIAEAAIGNVQEMTRLLEAAA